MSQAVSHAMSQAMSQEMSHFPSVSSQLLWPSQHCLLMDPQGIFQCHLILLTCGTPSSSRLGVTVSHVRMSCKSDWFMLRIFCPH